MIHEGLLLNYGVLDKDGTPIRSSQLDERGLYRLISGAMRELAEMNIPSCVDLSSVQSAVETWKLSYFIQGLKHFDTVDEMKEAIPYCFACFRNRPLEKAHIISRGADTRFIESVDNHILLCHTCHIEVQHRHGWQRLISKYPHLYPRIQRAYEIQGELND